MKTVIIIPSRLAAQRLANKPLADIGGEPMIVHVWRRAMEADCGRVVVAAGDAEIADVIENAGGQAVLTASDLPSGTDRVHAALCSIDADEVYQRVVNLQGDLPTLEPTLLRRLLTTPHDGDIMTLAAPIYDAREHTNPDVVKPIISFADEAAVDGKIGRALYFTRAPAPFDADRYYHHIGIYAYRRAALTRFVSLPPSPLEICERLEQLRALEAGMRIGVVIADAAPIGVDNATDLAHARAWLEKSSMLR